MDTIKEALKHLREDKVDDRVNDFINQWSSKYTLEKKIGGPKNVVEIPLNFIHPKGLLRVVDLSDTKLELKVLSNGIRFDIYAMSTEGMEKITPEYFSKEFLSKKAFENIVKMLRMQLKSTYIFKKCEKKLKQYNIDAPWIWITGNNLVVWPMHFYYLTKYWKFEFQVTVDLKTAQVDSKKTTIFIIYSNQSSTLPTSSFDLIMQDFINVFEGNGLKEYFSKVNSFLESLDADQMYNGQEWFRLTEEDL